jgi:hypothetical protein
MQAKEFAAEVGIELIDGQQLRILLAEYGNLEEHGPMIDPQG